MGIKNGKKITPKQKQFVLEYVKDKNGRQAVLRAGYSTKNPDQVFNKLVRISSVKEAVDQELKKQEDRLRITSDEVMKELANIARFDIADIYDENGSLKNIHDIPKEARMAISAVQADELFEGFGKDRERIGETKRVRLWDKLKALELIGKHFKMFTDKIDLGGKVDTEVTHKLGEEEKQDLAKLAKAIVQNKAK